MTEMTDYLTERAEAVVSVDEFVESCIDVPKFLSCCKECKNFGRRWSCPPFDFDPMDLWQKYGTLHLYTLILRPLDRDGTKLVEALWKEKADFNRELLELELRHPGSMALAGGSCSLCDVCAREEGKNCRYPGKQRYSIEALGGDVGKVCEKYFQKPVLWVKDGAAPDYLMWVGGLLLSE